MRKGWHEPWNGFGRTARPDDREDDLGIRTACATTFMTHHPLGLRKRR